MNKGGQGGIAAGMVIAAALLFRSGGPGGSPPAESSKGEVSKGSTAAARGSYEGPWIASCNYWAPVRPAGEPGENPAEIDGTMTSERVSLHVDLGAGDKAKGLGCGSDRLARWGFPQKGGPPKVTAMIATVSDPVHTHLALVFDRAVDAILQAATDNGYVSSQYWLPWKNRGTLRVEGWQDAEPGHDAEREREPGLIILKSEDFYKVIYLFLVAETPTVGVDGFQFQKAVAYERQLEEAIGQVDGEFSRGTKDQIAVIGPMYSGSLVSLHASIEAASQDSNLRDKNFHITGATSIKLPKDTGKIRYLSFGEDGGYGRKVFLDRLDESFGPRGGRVAFLVEDNTALGNTVEFASGGRKDVLVIRFPREISLLRNAQLTGVQSGDGSLSSGAAPSPYLRFSLKDYSAQDSVPQFSKESTPVSQEAQLMTIARELRRFRIQFIAIVASNVLDQIFLAQFLHRACPDARLMFFGSDLLLVRDVDDAPFIGSILITPYPLMGLGPAGRAYPSAHSLAFYNAVSYTFWDNGLGGRDGRPILQSYWNLADDDAGQPPLWATVIASDGYYPLGIVSARSSKPDSDQILPRIKTGHPPVTITIHPARFWYVLCVLVFGLCGLHILILWAADYWSPLTRDLALRENDEPRRRSVLVHVATAMLFSMAVVVTLPVLCFRLPGIAQIRWFSKAISGVTLMVGAGAVITAFVRTWDHLGFVTSRDKPGERLTRLQRACRLVRENSYLFCNLAAWATIAGVTLLWGYLCLKESPGGSATCEPANLFGLSFCYRSIHPGNGVSPIAPVLLLIFAWYVWAVVQTRRLRFSENGRPRLPEKLANGDDVRLFVSDDELAGAKPPLDIPLYESMTCLMITRQVLWRFWRRSHHNALLIDISIAAICGGLFYWFAFVGPLRGVDHLLWNTGGFSSPYEFLVGGLFISLGAVAVAGWIRMFVIWSALRKGLLERLENIPIRFAFDRLRVTGWMTMLRQAGVHEQWRDMARCLESMRQMLHEPDLWSLAPQDRRALETANADLLETIRQLRGRFNDPGSETGKRPYEYMTQMERQFAAFSKELLASVLIPYWKNERTGLVDSEEPGGGQATKPPARILVAEEFLAIRYVALIRAVLANMRDLVIFFSAAFVLATLAWNCYPFQPHQLGNWLFTALLAILGTGVIWVFAQMHRSPILSRITDKKPNELGWDFYVRVLSFGALPVLTWLAYQFPDIGSVIYKILQPGVSVIK